MIQKILGYIIHLSNLKFEICIYLHSEFMINKLMDCIVCHDAIINKKYEVIEDNLGNILNILLLQSVSFKISVFVFFQNLWDYF